MARSLVQHQPMDVLSANKTSSKMRNDSHFALVETHARSTVTTMTTIVASLASSTLSKKAKQVTEASLNTGTSIVCRFFFFVTLVFKVLEDGIERVRRLRRRGKSRVFKPFVASTN